MAASSTTPMNQHLDRYRRLGQGLGQPIAPDAQGPPARGEWA
ncbi:MAG: hypothetical protein QM742_12570 [Aquabacterium sp.]